MGSSDKAYYEDIEDYQKLCKDLKIEPRDLTVHYTHFQELKKLPCVSFENGQYKVDFENYPEYLL